MSNEPQVTDPANSDPNGDTAAEELSRREAARAKELSDRDATIAEFQRKDVMRDAGVDIKSPLGQLFLNGYKGELTEEAVNSPLYNRSEGDRGSRRGAGPDDAGRA
jgi:hypothetical protein